MKTQRLLTIVFAGTLASAGVGYTAVAHAQVKAQQTEHAGQPSQKVNVERGEVVWTSGNNVMIKQEDGQLKFFQNVSESARATVDGKQLNVHQLTPGMKLERTTITTTTPKTIRTVKTLSGTVWHVTPPNSIILTLDNKTNQSFTIPKGQKFMVEGKEVDAFELRPGMRISVTAVSESSSDEVSQQVRTTGVAPPPAAPPAPPAPNVAILIIRPIPPTPVPTTGEKPAPAPAKELPHTASEMPLTGLLAVSLFGFAMCVRWLRLKTADVR
jgi:FlaG/FlaF family flagellin (archaellin)